MAYSVVRKMTGTLIVASGTLTWSGTPASGNLLLLAGGGSHNTKNTLATPTGWTLAKYAGPGGGADAYLFYKVAGASETTSIAVAPGVGSVAPFMCSFAAYELNPFTATPMDASQVANLVAAATTTWSSGATTTTVQAAELCVGVFASGYAANPWTSYAAGYTLQDAVSCPRPAGSSWDLTIACIFKEVAATGAQTATATTASTTQGGAALVGTFKENLVVAASTTRKSLHLQAVQTASQW